MTHHKRGARYLATAGAVTALALAGGLPAMASPGPAFQMSVSPPKIVGAQGVHQFTKTILITNSGTKTLTVKTSWLQLVKVGGKCGEAKPPSWVQVHPAAFTLPTGKHQHVRLTVTAPKSAKGHYDEAALFSGASASHKSKRTNVQITGSVGVRVILNLNGKSAAAPCEQASQPHQTKPGSPVWPAYITLAAVLALIIGTARWLIIRRRRKGGGAMS